MYCGFIVGVKAIGKFYKGLRFIKLIFVRGLIVQG